MNQTLISTSKPTASSLIAERQSTLNITDEQLAVATGFESAKVISMIKAGALKLPVNKIISFAAALSIDPVRLLRIHLTETAPDIIVTIDALMSSQLLTANEVKLIENYRYLSKGNDVCPVVMDGANLIALVSA